MSSPRRLSARPGNLEVRQQPRAPQFPLGTLFYARKDGAEVSFLMNNVFLKRRRAGEPMPAVQVLTGRDFRRAADLFTWLGGGAAVEIHCAADPAGLTAAAEHYGVWDGRILKLN